LLEIIFARLLGTDASDQLLEFSSRNSSREFVGEHLAIDRSRADARLQTLLS